MKLEVNNRSSWFTNQSCESRLIHVLTAGNQADKSLHCPRGTDPAVENDLIRLRKGPGLVLQADSKKLIQNHIIHTANTKSRR